MKREELTPIELECNMGKDINGVVHREPWKAYDIDEVNLLLDQYEEEISTLKAKLEDRGCPELHAYKADVQIPVYGSIADADVYLKDKVDAVIATRENVIFILKTCLDERNKKVDEKDAEIASLKAKLENVQASAYADSVDAGMRERRLLRALWLARALRARDIQRWWIAATCAPITERACSVWNNVERKCLEKAEEYK